MNKELKKAASIMGKKGGRSRSPKKLKALKRNRKKSIVKNIHFALHKRMERENPNPGLEIAIMRGAAEMTQSELAERMQVSRQTIHAWEHNRPEIGESLKEEIRLQIEDWKAGRSATD